MDEKTLKKKIFSALQTIKDINSSESIVSSGTLHNITIGSDHIDVILNVNNNPPQDFDEIQNLCKKAIYEINQEKKVNLILTSEKNNKQKEDIVHRKTINPEKVRDIILIASGKGGVGKSTITNNLAISMAKKGLKIGILDADIYGPSQPKMLGISSEKPNTNQDGKIIPIEKYGIKCMSIGLLIDETRPIVWRGPMVQGALEQLIKDVEWGELDILILDLPPGTGDTQLSISQKVQVSGAIIISTPQDISLLDAVKGLNMFKKVGVPIIGIIENMSFYLCPSCNKKQEIFGHGGAKSKARELNTPFLGEIPLNIEIRKNSDIGKPIIEEDYNSINNYFIEISKKVVDFIREK